METYLIIRAVDKLTKTKNITEITNSIECDNICFIFQLDNSDFCNFPLLLAALAVDYVYTFCHQS